jgi:hypothetical protein
MAEFDLVAALVAIGVDETAADELKWSISGGEYMNLVNALNKPMASISDPIVKSVLAKYGIAVGAGSEDTMTEQSGKLTRIGEGFNYSVEVNSQNRDKVLDWLDENQVSYEAVTPLSYKVECSDRETAYRTGRAISEILRKPTVRDSIEVIESEDIEEMSKNSNKRANTAKQKMADMKPRNPLAAMPVAGRAGAHADGKDPRRVDNKGRSAKHKGRRFDEEIEFAIGDEVMVGEEIGTIKIPHGPNGTIGVLMNGSLEMVAETEVNRLDEGVMGMSKLNPLFRLRELAGLPTASGDEVGGIEISEPVSDPAGPLGAGEVGTDLGSEVEGPEMGDDLGAEMPDASADAIDDLGPIDGPEMGGVPGDLPPVNPEAVPGVDAMGPVQSEAMGQIEDSLNSVQSMLGEIRLGEYKALIQKLQDLTNQVQMMGRDYLGERRKK